MQSEQINGTSDLPCQMHSKSHSLHHADHILLAMQCKVKRHPFLMYE